MAPDLIWSGVLKVRGETTYGDRPILGLADAALQWITFPANKEPSEADLAMTDRASAAYTSSSTKKKNTH